MVEIEGNRIYRTAKPADRNAVVATLFLIGGRKRIAPIRIPDEKEIQPLLVKNESKTNTKTNIDSEVKPLASAARTEKNYSLNKEDISDKIHIPVYSNGKNESDLDIEFIQEKNPPIG